MLVTKLSTRISGAQALKISYQHAAMYDIANQPHLGPC